MRPEYEQMELDTRKSLDIAIYKVAEDAVATAREMVEASQVAPSMVRNRHEAYGIAAERKAAGTASRKQNRQRPGKSPGMMKTDPQAPGRSSAQRNKGGKRTWQQRKTAPNWPPLATSS